mgnify:FL=1|jgi:hypothetical protein|tara:strand:+ start:816 stop:1238 length:423 start_codon:yes stop_codon:yes gene_type:complete
MSYEYDEGSDIDNYEDEQVFQDNQQDKKDEMSESRINHGPKGFQMTFENGYTLSVQYGRGNYCERRNDYMVYDQNDSLEEPSADKIISKDCEIAVWHDGKGGYVQLSEHDAVRGWVPIEDLPQIMVYVQTGDFDAIRATE